MIGIVTYHLLAQWFDRGEQTDVPESADWYNSDYIIAWGQTYRKLVDAHFFTEVR